MSEEDPQRFFPPLSTAWSHETSPEVIFTPNKRDPCGVVDTSHARYARAGERRNKFRNTEQVAVLLILHSHRRRATMMPAMEPMIIMVENDRVLWCGYCDVGCCVFRKRLGIFPV